MILCFDIDGTICSSVSDSRYEEAVPDIDVIDSINRLYNDGNTIKIMTARGSVSGIDHTELTRKQLKDWGVSYHELIMNYKPHADLFIDDRAINISEWKRMPSHSRGVVAGAFDLIHVGYVRMFRQAKLHCGHLTVALHINPNVENGKPVPVQTAQEREEILRSIKYVDDVVLYQTEEELASMLASGQYDVRFLGSDYIDKPYTAPNLPIKIFWIERDHGYSTTDLKSRIRGSQ